MRSTQPAPVCSPRKRLSRQNVVAITLAVLDNRLVPLTHPAPTALDPDVLESAARDLASTGAITFLVDDDASLMPSRARRSASARGSEPETPSCVFPDRRGTTWLAKSARSSTCCSAMSCPSSGAASTSWPTGTRSCGTSTPASRRTIRLEPTSRGATRSPRSRSTPATPSWPRSCRPWVTCTSRASSTPTRCGPPTARSTALRPRLDPATTGRGGSPPRTAAASCADWFTQRCARPPSPRWKTIPGCAGSAPSSIPRCAPRPTGWKAARCCSKCLGTPAGYPTSPGIRTAAWVDTLSCAPRSASAFNSPARTPRPAIFRWYPAATVRPFITGGNSGSNRYRS